jgi:hypothetical protein
MELTGTFKKGQHLMKKLHLVITNINGDSVIQTAWLNEQTAQNQADKTNKELEEQGYGKAYVLSIPIQDFDQMTTLKPQRMTGHTATMPCTNSSVMVIKYDEEDPDYIWAQFGQSDGIESTWTEPVKCKVEQDQEGNDIFRLPGEIDAYSVSDFLRDDYGKGIL